MKEKHVEKLTRGKKSGAKIGSRNVPHRLTKYEEIKFNKAIKKRFMTLQFDSRPNLKNIWLKYSEAKGWPCIIITRLQDGSAKLLHDHANLTFETFKEADAYAKEVIT